MNDRYEVGYRLPGRIYDLDRHCNKKAEAFAAAARLAARIREETDPETVGIVYDRYAHPRRPDGWAVQPDGSAVCFSHRPEVA